MCSIPTASRSNFRFYRADFAPQSIPRKGSTPSTTLPGNFHVGTKSAPLKSKIGLCMAERCNYRLLTRNLIFDFIGYILPIPNKTRTGRTSSTTRPGFLFIDNFSMCYILAQGVLEQAQVELRGEGGDVGDDLGLQLFVGHPIDIRREAVELHRKAPLGGLQLAYQNQ